MTHENLTTRQILNRIYHDIDGFEIPVEDRKKVRKSKGSPVYGEINHAATNKLLKHLGLRGDDTFYDLGSGVGKVLIHALLVTPIKKAVGIELSKTRHQEAMAARRRALKIKPSLKGRLKLVNNDLLLANLSDANVIYTCSTAFSLLFMNKMVKHLSTFDHYFRLVTLQEIDESKYFKLIDKLRLDMSWTRNTTVYIYERLSS